MLETIAWPVCKLIRVFSTFQPDFQDSKSKLPRFQVSNNQLSKFQETKVSNYVSNVFRPSVFAQFRVKMFHLRVNRTFSKYSLISTFFIQAYHPERFQNPFFNWIWKKRYTRFWAQLGVDMLHLGPKGDFQKYFSLQSLFIYLVHYIIVQNFKINPLIGFQEVVVKARGFSLGKKALILGQKKFS